MPSHQRRELHVGDKVGERTVVEVLGYRQGRGWSAKLRCVCQREDVVVSIRDAGDLCMSCARADSGVSALLEGQCLEVDAVDLERCWGDLPCRRHAHGRNAITPIQALNVMEREDGLSLTTSEDDMEAEEGAAA